MVQRRVHQLFASAARPRDEAVLRPPTSTGTYDWSVQFFSWFLDTVPGWLRLVLAMAITIGVTLTFVAVFHKRILAMDADPDEEGIESGADQDTEDEDDTDPDARADSEKRQPAKAPPSFYLGGRAISLVSVAFVFIFAFCVNNFWTNNQNARAAVANELADITRISALAENMGGPAAGQLLDSVAAYRRSITESEWPLMQEANVNAASQAHERASLAVAAALLKAQTEGAGDSPEWTPLTAAVDDMVSQGKDRTNYLPAPAAPGMISLIFILGITNLALTAAYQPARLRQHLFLLGVMAGITALMFFLVVEASNPYVGSGGISPAIYSP